MPAAIFSLFSVLISNPMLIGLWQIGQDMPKHIIVLTRNTRVINDGHGVALCDKQQASLDHALTRIGLQRLPALARSMIGYGASQARDFRARNHGPHPPPWLPRPARL